LGFASAIIDTMARKSDRDLLQKNAWIGDAVLSLYVRLRILREDGVVDGPKASRMTSNEFLVSVGEATEVEAELGQVFEQHGLESAFEWIEQRLMPIFEKREAKRSRSNRP
jgi:hypothetical protein